MAVLAEEADLEVDQAVQLVGRVVGGGHHLAQRRHVLVAASHEHADVEVFLVLEERVDRADRELGQLGHLLEGGLVEALAPEDLLRRVEQLRATQVLVLGSTLLPAAGLRRLGRPFDRL